MIIVNIYFIKVKITLWVKIEGGPLNSICKASIVNPVFGKYMKVFISIYMK